MKYQLRDDKARRWYARMVELLGEPSFEPRGEYIGGYRSFREEAEGTVYFCLWCGREESYKCVSTQIYDHHEPTCPVLLNQASATQRCHRDGDEGIE